MSALFFNSTGYHTARVFCDCILNETSKNKRTSHHIILIIQCISKYMFLTPDFWLGCWISDRQCMTNICHIKRFSITFRILCAFRWSFSLQMIDIMIDGQPSEQWLTMHPPLHNWTLFVDNVSSEYNFSLWPSLDDKTGRQFIDFFDPDHKRVTEGKAMHFMNN